MLEHRLLEDVFLGAPSEDRPQQTECIWRILYKSSFGSFFLAAFLKKRISTLITTGKQHKVLIRYWRNAFDVYSLEAHLEVFFLLRFLRNAHRRWLSRNFIGKYYFPVGFQPMNIALLVSKSVWKIRGKYRKGKVCLPNYFENTWKKAVGYHFQALTFTLTIIVFKALQR